VPLKILAVQNKLPTAAFGGAELLCRDILIGLSKAGHNVMLLTTGPDIADLPFPVIPRMSSLKDGGTSTNWNNPLQRVRWTRVSGRNYSVTANSIRDCRPDIVYVHNTEWLTHAPILAAEAAGIPCVLHAHNHQFAQMVRERTGNPNRLKRLLHSHAPRLDHARIIAISRSIADGLEEAGLPSDRIHIINNGIDPSLLSSPPSNDRTPNLVLCAGAVSPHKGTHLAVEAMGRLAETNPELRLRIVGGCTNESYRHDMEKLIAGSNAKERITFTGPMSRKELFALMRETTVAVVPSLCEEAFGLVAAEAMACGALTIVSNRGALPEVTGGFAEVVSPDVGTIADTVERLLVLPPERASIVRSAAFDHVKKNYSFGRAMKMVGEVLESALE